MAPVSIEFDAKTAKAQRDIDSINQSIKNIEKTSSSTSQSINKMIKVLASSAAIGLSLNYLKQVSTEFTNMDNRIATVTGRTRSLVRAQQELYDISTRTYSRIQDSAELFASFGRPLKSQGVELKNILKATETIQKSIAISGAGAESAKSAIIQLGQGISAGALRGQELIAVMEQVPRVAEAIADGMGFSYSAMKKMGEEGKLTSKKVFEAILSQSEKINKEFANFAPSLTMTYGNLADSIKIYVREFDKGFSITGKMTAKWADISKLIRKSAEDAEDMGAKAREGLNTLKNHAVAIGGPILKIAKNLLTMIGQGLPKIFGSKTLMGDLRTLFGTLDQKTGRWVEKWRKFRFVDIIGLESDVELAIRSLKRLSPKYWTAGGFDRLFSTENIKAYEKALKSLADAVAGNQKTLGSRIANLSSSIESGLKRVVRYFDLTESHLFTLKAGNLEDFLLTLSQIIRGLSGAVIKVWEVSKILTRTVLPNIYTFSYAVMDALGKLPAFISNVFQLLIKLSKKFVKAFSSFVSELEDTITIFKMPFQNLIEAIIEGFEDMVDDIKKVVKRVRSALDPLKVPLTNIKMSSVFDAVESGIEKTLEVLRKANKEIAKFGRGVIDTFEEIYDEVIGHSWWTDLVDEVVGTANNLWNMVSNGFKRFKDNIENVFQDLYEKAKLRFDVEGFDKVREAFKAFKMPTFDIEDMSTFFSTLYVETKKVLAKAFEYLPELTRMVLSGIGMIIVGLLFPKGLFKKTLIILLLDSLLTGGALISEKLYAVLNNKSLAYSIGKQIGDAVGFVVDRLIKEIPKILSAIGGALSGFFRGFSEQMPLVGVFMKALFKVTDLMGISGPVGLVGGLLFGKNVLKLSALLGFQKKSIDKFFKTIATFMAYTKSPGKQGWIGHLLFGKVGAANVGLGLLSILSIFGGFDSIFEGHQFTKALLDMGIVSLLMYGKTGTFGPALGMFKEAMKTIQIDMKAFLSNKSIFGVSLADAFFGDFAEDMSRRAGLEVPGLGSRLARSFGKMRDNAFRRIPKPKNGFQSLLPFTLMDNFFAKMASKSQAMAVMMGKMGGANGLMSRLLFGKLGMIAMVTGILVMIASLAKANEMGQARYKPIDKVSAFDDFKENWKDFKLENPVTAMVTEIVTVSLPLAFAALLLFKRKAIATIWKSFPLAPVRLFGEAVVATFRLMAGHMALALAGALSGVIGGALGAMASDDGEFSWIGAMIGAQIGAGIVSAYLKHLASLGAKAAAAGGVLALKIVAALAATLAVAFGVGVLFKWLFGDKTLSEELKESWKWLKKIVGMDTEEKNNTTGITKRNERFAQRERLNIDWDLSEIDWDNVNKKDKKKIEEHIGEMNTQISSLREEYIKTGMISPQHREDWQKMTQEMTKVIEDMAAESMQGLGNVDVLMDKLLKAEPKNRVERAMTSSKQAVDDALYKSQEMYLRTLRAWPSITVNDQHLSDRRKNMTLRLNEIEAKRNTIYNAKFKYQEDAYTNAFRFRYKEQDEKPEASPSIEKTIKELEFALKRTVLELDNPDARRFGGMLPDTQREYELRKKINGLMESLNSTWDEKDAWLKKREEISEYERKISEVSNSLKKLDIDFKTDKTAMFAGPDDMNALENMKTKADKLYTSLENIASLADQKRVVMEIEILRTETFALNERAKAASSSRKQFELAQGMSALGLEGYTDQAFMEVGDKVARDLNDKRTDLLIKLEKLKTEAPSMSEYEHWNMMVGIRKEEFPKARKEFEDELNAFNKETEAAIRKSGRKGWTGYLAGKTGIDFDALAIQRGALGATRAMEQMSAAMDRLNEAKRTGSGVAAAARNVALLREQLQKAPTDISTFMGYISELDKGLELDQIVALSDSDFDSMRRVGALMSQNESLMTGLGSSVSKSNFAKILKNKLDAGAIAFKNFLKTMFSTSESIQRQMESLGDIDWVNLSQDGFENLQKLIKNLAIAKNKLAHGGKKFYRENAANVDRAQKALDLALDKAKKVADKVADITGKLDVDITPIQFEFLPEKVRADLKKQADVVAKDQQDALDNIMKGNAESASSYFEVFKKKLAANLKTTEEIAKSGADLKIDFATIGSNTKNKNLDYISAAMPNLKDMEEVLNKLDPGEIKGFAEEVAKYNHELDKYNKGFSTKSLSDLQEMAKTIEDSISASLDRVKYGASLKAALKRHDKNIEDGMMGFIDAFEMANLMAYARKLDELKAKIEAAKTPEEKQEAEKEYGLVSKRTDKELDRAKDDVSLRAMEAGTALTEAVAGGLKDSLKSLLKGETSIGDFFGDVFGNITSSIVDTMINGLMDPLTGDNGVITKFFESFGESLFSSASEVFNGLGSKAGGWFKSALSWVGTLFGLGEGVARAATGGLIKGPGTGTSDSIPYWLSNGEYVVNAKATKENLALLQALNSGKPLAKFAAGGLVSPTNLQQPSRADLSQREERGSKVEQTWNLGITGDISRQTRREIMRLIPEISHGVNSYNKEYGLNRR